MTTRISPPRPARRPLILAAGIAALLGAFSAAPAQAAVTFIGSAAITGTAADKSGLSSATLEDGASPHNGLNGFGSSIAYAGGNTYYLLADRGPNKIAYAGGAAVDNTTTFENRFQRFTIDLTSAGNGKYTVTPTNTGTTLLKNPAGQQYLGISTGYQATPNRRFDSEGVCVAPDGTMWMSDEYGPFLLHFNQQGQQIGSLTLPPGFVIANPRAKGSDEIAANPVGRVNNKGMEGVAISPDGTTLVGIMQSPLTQDGGVAGLNVRLVAYDLRNPAAAPKQFIYPLDDVKMANSEILAVNSHQFLIDERDAAAGNIDTTNGSAPSRKYLYQVDLNQAVPPTDLTNTAYAGTGTTNGLPNSGSPAGIVPLQKTLFANIGSLLINGGAFTTDSANFRTDLPDKIEGYCWGPDLPDGRHLLLATNDNDFAQPATTAGGALTGKAFPNYIFAFAVDPADAPDFQPKSFNTDAINSIEHIVVIYQENWSFDGLYGSFPGANGVSSASTASLTQIDRLTGNALSTQTGTDNYNRLSQTNNTANNPVPANNSLTNPGLLNTPPQPLGSPTGTSVVDTRFSVNPADPRSSLLINPLQPYTLPTFVQPTALTGDIVHRYWNEQFQIYGAQAGNIDHGANSGFLTWSDNPGMVMSRYDATNLPEGVLAQQYTICDNFFHSAFGGSFLNHQFLIAAAAPVYDNMPTTNNGNVAYLDTTGLFVLNTSGPATGKQVQDGNITPIGGESLNVTVNGTATTVTANGVAFFDGSTFDKHYTVNTIRSKNLTGNGESPNAITTLASQNDSNPTNTGGDTRPYIPTIGDALSQADVSWKWYSGKWDLIKGYSGANPSPIVTPTYASVNPLNQFQYHHQPFAYYDNYAPFGTAVVPATYVGGFAGVGAAGLTAHQAGVTQAQNSAAHLQDEDNFFTDVQNGTLPAVSFIKAVGVNNEHPGYATLQTGQAHVASLLQALQANPAVWAHTAVFVTYDEHGGRWDHVTPPARDIWGPGVRVPCLVLSPLVKKGYVDHVSRDTSSILSTIEQRFNLASLNQRDASAPTFFDLFTALDISRSAYQTNTRTHKVTQTVTVTNRSASPILGPVQLVLDNLTATTTLNNKSGVTTNTAPGGSPYITLTSGSLAPGATASITLTFDLPASGGINYTARTVTGTANP